MFCATALNYYESIVQLLAGVTQCKKFALHRQCNICMDGNRRNKNKALASWMSRCGGENKNKALGFYEVCFIKVGQKTEDKKRQARKQNRLATLECAKRKKLPIQAAQIGKHTFAGAA